jgi:hypothetical protein
MVVRRVRVEQREKGSTTRERHQSRHFMLGRERGRESIML